MKYLIIGKNMANDGKSDPVILAFILENMGMIYTDLNNFTQAEELLLEAKMLCKKDIKYDYISGYILNSLAVLYLKMNRLEEALVLIEEAIVKAKRKDFNSILIESYKNKSHYALQIENNDLFIKNINVAISYSKKETLSKLQIDCLKLLKKFYWKRKEYKQACNIADQIIEINLRIDQTREHNSVAELLEKRASEIVILENKNRMISRQKEELEQFAYIVAHDLKAVSYTHLTLPTILLV